MISYNSETNFDLNHHSEWSLWLSSVIKNENRKEGDINYIFCDDEYLLRLNKTYLMHDTLTDIITFDYCVGKTLHGDVFISIDRVKDNAVNYSESFKAELARVMVHGVLHLVGFKDKSTVEATLMRAKENYYLGQFDFLLL